MPAERKYKSAAALERAIEKYLRSIRTREVSRFDSVDGKPIVYESYIVPPTLGDIIHVLRISRQTWSRYANGELGADYARVCADAKDECERWLARELLTRQKSVDGIKWNLQCNFGWSEKREDDASREIVVRLKGDTDDFAG